MFADEPRPRRHHLLRWLLALAVLLLITESAGAGEPAIPLDGPRLAQAPEPLCFCWNDGRKVAEGSASCIRTTQGRRIATCGRVTNLMSWQVTETPCPES
ncbi:hypothetical protein [Bosea sp. (in: a-proteobacteria)]|uniref:hypothetical protein n=1 Tax=Bosea sp. (in: a-proteobacteria) TaxID=1871050 RepID=UPI0033401282